MTPITHVVGKTLIFNRQGQLLLLVRSADDTYRPGAYDLPGGQVDEGEEYLAGAVRELAEETGLVVDPAAMRLEFATAKTNFRSEFGQEVNIVWLGYVAAMPENSEVTLSLEHSEYRWFTVSEAMEVAESSTHLVFIQHLVDNAIAKELWQEGR